MRKFYRKISLYSLILAISVVCGLFSIAGLIDGELTGGNVSPPPIKVFTPIFPPENVAPITKLAGTTSKSVAFPKMSTIFRILGPKGSKNFQNPKILVLEKNFCPKNVPS